MEETAGETSRDKMQLMTSSTPSSVVLYRWPTLTQSYSEKGGAPLTAGSLGHVIYLSDRYETSCLDDLTFEHTQTLFYRPMSALQANSPEACLRTIPVPVSLP